MINIIKAIINYKLILIKIISVQLMKYYIEHIRIFLITGIFTLAYIFESNVRKFK